VLAAIRFHHGNISAIAEQFGRFRNVIYNKINSSKVLMQAQQNERERWKDLAERNANELLEARDIRFTMFVLTTLCASRGWVLPKNLGGSGPFGDGEGKISEVNVNGINITAYDEGQFAKRGTPAVTFAALPPPPEPDDDGVLTIEGELAKSLAITTP
jgi:hypothetical protein